MSIMLIFSFFFVKWIGTIFLAKHHRYILKKRRFRTKLFPLSVILLFHRGEKLGVNWLFPWPVGKGTNSSVYVSCAVTGVSMLTFVQRANKSTICTWHGTVRARSPSRAFLNIANLPQHGRTKWPTTAISFQYLCKTHTTSTKYYKYPQFTLAAPFICA